MKKFKKSYLVLSIIVASNSLQANNDLNNEIVNNDISINSNNDINISYRNSILNGNLDVQTNDEIALSVFQNSSINGEVSLSSPDYKAISIFDKSLVKEGIISRNGDFALSIFDDSVLEGELDVKSEFGSSIAVFDNAEVNGNINIDNDNYDADIGVFNNSKINGNVNLKNKNNRSSFEVFANSNINGNINLESYNLDFYLDRNSEINGDINFINKNRGENRDDYVDIPNDAVINGDLNLMTGNDVSYYSGTLDLNGNLNIGKMSEEEVVNIINGNSFQKLVTLNSTEKENYYLDKGVAQDISLTTIETDIDGNIEAHSSNDLRLSAINSKLDNIVGSFENELYLLLEQTEVENITLYNTIPSNSDTAPPRNIFIINSSIKDGLTLRNENELGESVDTNMLIQGNKDMILGGINLEKGNIDLSVNISPDNKLEINDDIVTKSDSFIDITNNSNINITSDNLFMARIVNKDGSSLNIENNKLLTNSDAIFESGSVLTLKIENNENGSFNLSENKEIIFQDGSSLEVEILGKLYNNQNFTIINAEKGNLDIGNDQISLNSDGYDVEKIAITNDEKRVVLSTPTNERNDYRINHFVNKNILNEKTLNDIRKSKNEKFFIDSSFSNYDSNKKSYENKQVMFGGDVYDTKKLKLTPFFVVSRNNFKDINYESETNNYGLGLYSKYRIDNELSYNHYTTYSYSQHEVNSKEYISGFDYIKGDYKEHNFYTSGDFEITKEIGDNKISAYTGLSYSISNIGEYQAGIPDINDFDEVKDKNYNKASIYQGVGFERNVTIKNNPIAFYANTYLRKDLYDNFDNNNDKNITANIGLKTNNPSEKLNFYFDITRTKSNDLKGNSVRLKLVKKF